MTTLRNLSLIAALSCITLPALADDAEPKTQVDISGLYTAWGLSQYNFMLGAEHPLDDAAYTVQMLRVNTSAHREHMGVVARADLAQGWWGVDNNPRPDGDSIFQNKGTNYGVHLDVAYGWVSTKAGDTDVVVQVGRQLWRPGHGLVLDRDIDGIVVHASPSPRAKITASWGKLSEGLGSTMGPVGPLMSDKDERGDASLASARVQLKLGGDDAAKAPTAIDVFAVGYQDKSTSSGAAYLPEGLGYTRARFTPQISQALVTGVAAKTKLDVAEGLLLDGEVDFLVGKDDIDNDTYNANKVDKNDGDLIGYNIYASAKQNLDVGVPLDINLRFGMGSGDDDPTSGKGNFNRLVTMGFFPVTNVFEDSVMPDVQGISPQGLGSPVSRGYRELENTTMVQGKVGVLPHKKVRVEASYTYFMATAPVRAWNADGPLGDSASDLGQEIDLNLTLKLRKGVVFKSLGGVFLPGDAAGYLINGNTDSLDPAMEVKNVLVIKI